VTRSGRCSHSNDNIPLLGICAYGCNKHQSFIKLIVSVCVTACNNNNNNMQSSNIHLNNIKMFANDIILLSYSVNLTNKISIVLNAFFYILGEF